MKEAKKVLKIILTILTPIWILPFTFGILIWGLFKAGYEVVDTFLE